MSNEHVSSHPVPIPILGWDGLLPRTLAHPGSPSTWKETSYQCRC